MINKEVQTMAQAMEGIKDGDVIYIGGFGQVGHPLALIDGLIETGAKDLVIISNNAGFANFGMPRLMHLGRVRKIICSFPRTGNVAAELYANGKLELEIVPQGTLAERIRAAGAGIAGFFTQTAYGTKLAEGKETREMKGRNYVFEEALPADYALIEAYESDRWGNLTYLGAGKNFNAVMAMGAKVTIAQVQRMVPLGSIDPMHVGTPSILVDRVIAFPYEPPYESIKF